MNLCYLIGQKCIGKSIEGDLAIERLIEIRTVLEHIRPIDQKLKYQIEKFVKIALTRTSDKKDVYKRQYPGPRQARSKGNQLWTMLDLVNKS